MDKIDFKELAHKAKSEAGDGIKKVGEAAQKAAAGVNDGIDSAKEALKRNAIAKNAVKELQKAIKDLEKENKAKVQGDVQEETNAIIEQLKILLQIIKNDPENCVEAVEKLASEYRLILGDMINSEQSGADLIKLQIMSKRYEDALKSCQSAKAAIEKELETENC